MDQIAVLALCIGVLLWVGGFEASIAGKRNLANWLKYIGSIVLFLNTLFIILFL